MGRLHLLSGLAFCAAFAATPQSTLASPASNPGSPGPEDPETVAAQRGPFSVVLEFTGSFDAPAATEVLLRPEVYRGELEVAEVVTPGPVTKGQCLVRFGTEKIDEQIQQAEIDLNIARTGFARKSEEAKLKEEAAAIELKNAEMSYQRARQTHDTFKEVLMPMRIAEAELGIQSTRDRLKEQEEQFVQLQKMYKSDDLVEETEEIVLRREKRSLDQARTRLAFSERRHELTLKIDIPRELKGYEFALRKATNDWELAQATAKLRLEQSASELKKAGLALRRQETAFLKLQADRAALVVCASEAGVAVPGQLSGGKWTRLTENARSLRPGEKLPAGQVLFTIVQPGPRSVRTKVPEASVLDVAQGQSAVVSPVATPGSTLSAKVTHVARVSTDGQFDTWLEVAGPDSRLIAGNACSIAITTREFEDAVTVPATAVATEDGSSFVHVWKNGSSQRREVQVGPTSGGRTLIESGLEAGESVVLLADKVK